MRAVVDSGCTRTIVTHPRYCVPGSVKKLDKPVPISGIGGKVQASYTGTLEILSNIPGCTRSIILRDCLVASQVPRTLVSVAELDTMGYRIEIYDQTLYLSEKSQNGEQGPRTCIFPRYPEVNGVLIDEKDDLGNGKTGPKRAKGKTHALYPIPDNCFTAGAAKSLNKKARPRK